MKMSKAISLGALALTLVILMGLGLGGITNVDPGWVGLQVQMVGTKAERGMKDETLDTGLQWINPIKFDVPQYDTRSTQYVVEDMDAQTKDGQPILVDLSMEISLIDSAVPVLHETIGKNYYEQVVYPLFRAVTRNSLATEKSDAIYTGEARERIQTRINDILNTSLNPRGIRIGINFRDLDFTNKQFVKTLEQKATAAQQEEIERRFALAAEQAAVKVANIAEGAKQKVIKEAEADAERLRLNGLGQRQQKEELAKGILAVGQAEAEVIRLRNDAMDGPGGDKIVAMAWAENLGPNVKVYGFPTGAAGTTSLMDLNGIMQGALKGTVMPK